MVGGAQARASMGGTLFEHVKLHLRAGDRVALIGDNGVGKSTLFKCLIGEEQFDEGTVRLGTGVDIGYYDQHQAHLHESKSVLDEVWDEFPRLEQSQVRGALGLFLFTGDDVFAPIATLSGGEKGRVALTQADAHARTTCCCWTSPRTTWTWTAARCWRTALEDYPGTILAISHDRYFINRFATRVMVLEQGGVKEYLGNYDDYFEKINRGQEPDGDLPQITRTAQDKEKRRSREATQRLKALKAAVAQAEAAVAQAEQEQAELEALMAAPETYQDAAKAAELGRRYQQIQQEVARRYEAWEQAEAELGKEE